MPIHAPGPDVDPHEPTNEQRADRADYSLREYSARDGARLSLDPVNTVLDFLADLSHFCDRHNLDLPDLLRRARNRYREETNGQGQQLP